MMRLKDKDKGVPDFFRYTNAETTHVSRGQNWWEWEKEIMDHRKGNNLPIPDNMMELAEHQLCQQLDPHWCEHGDQNARHVKTRLSLLDIAHGGLAYAEVFTKKLLGVDEIVSQNEADRRAKICAGCFLRVRPEGCGACNRIADAVTGGVAGLKSTYDSHLDGFACAVCQCPSKPLVHFPLSILERYDTPEKQALYPEFCWRSKQSPNYHLAAA